MLHKGLESNYGSAENMHASVYLFIIVPFGSQSFTSVQYFSIAMAVTHRSFSTRYSNLIMNIGICKHQSFKSNRIPVRISSGSKLGSCQYSFCKIFRNCDHSIK